jgi:hypothetical protein
MMFINLLGPPTHKQYHYFIIPFKGYFSTASPSELSFVSYGSSSLPLETHYYFIYIHICTYIPCAHRNHRHNFIFFISEHYRMLIINCARNAPVLTVPQSFKCKNFPMAQYPTHKSSMHTYNTITGTQSIILIQLHRV